MRNAIGGGSLWENGLEKEINNFQYFFIVYEIPGIAICNGIFPQKITAGSERHGLNYCAALRLLEKLTGEMPVIVFAQETTEKRYAEWKTLMKNLQREADPKKGLSVVDGGGENSPISVERKKKFVVVEGKPPETTPPGA